MADLTEFEMVDVAAVVRVLGLSRTMVYNLLRAGELPGIKIGATWRILVADLRRYLASNRFNAGAGVN